MATTVLPPPSPSHSPSPVTSPPPTPPTRFPSFPRLSSASPSIQRNASTSSSRSTTTISSTSSVEAAAIRPPPIETSTAATSRSQLPASARGSASASETEAARYGGPELNGYTHTGRAWSRNGPRVNRLAHPPMIVTSSASPSPVTSPPASRPSTAQSYGYGGSPTTPRQLRAFGAQQDHPRVTVSLDPSPSGFLGDTPTPPRGRMGSSTTPSSPTGYTGPRDKPRTLSVDAGPTGYGGPLVGRRSGSMERERERERRHSQMSGNGNGSGTKQMTIHDWVLGEELGQGSYSTVYAVTPAASTTSPTSPRPPRKYAMKIINQQHLINERKVKYAKIERDALVRLSRPRESSPTVARGHRRGLSSSSSAGLPQSQSQSQQQSQSQSQNQQASASRRRSTASLASSAGPPRKDSGATITANDNLTAPQSPVLSTAHGRRPSRCAEPPEMVQVPEQETLLFTDPKAPTATAEEGSPVVQPSGVGTPDINSTPATQNNQRPRTQTPKPRRSSLAPSERSVKSTTGKIRHYPGVVRLFSTFADTISLYFVLDLVVNGELTGLIRKYGSFDLDSARYYAAQLIDAIEFMHERGVIHRDLKPENILIDKDMRIKVTDFGSAKLLDYEPDEEYTGEEKKRSFVGSADFVSPEVLRNEEASTASDVWAFGCVLFQLLAGKPPFRGATDYLIFQKILKREMEYPEGFDSVAIDLIDLMLNLDPTLRPSIAAIKSHPFFSSIDFYTLWTVPAPAISTGLVPPVATLAKADSNPWAVFDDEISDGGFEYDETPEPPADHSREPQFNRNAAAYAVHNVDNPHGHVDLSEVLDPPRPPYADQDRDKAMDRKKDRGWSHGSSSSGGNRRALSSFLETMRLGGHNDSHNHGQSNRTSRTSVRSDEIKAMRGASADRDREDQWSSLLLNNERIILTSPILARTTTQAKHLPAFLLPAPKRRQLILTDFPRLITVKDDDEAEGPRIKSECVFVVRPSTATGRSGGSAGAGAGAGGSGVVPNRVTDVQEKGSKGFIVQTPSANHHYTADSAELREKWMEAIKRVSA